MMCLHCRISKQDSLSGQLEKFSRQQPTIASASSLIQSLLKEGDVIKLTEDEQCQTCSILCTSEYCMETTQQLEDKLKEKVDPELVEKIDLRAEQDIFHKSVSLLFLLRWTHDVYWLTRSCEVRHSVCVTHLFTKALLSYCSMCCKVLSVCIHVQMSVRRFMPN